MIVVMPAGHTTPRRRRPRRAGTGRRTDEFVKDFTDRRHAVRREELPRADRPEQRAIAGLSMGGSQTLQRRRSRTSIKFALHRRLQLGPARRVPGLGGGRRAGRAGRQAAAPAAPAAPAARRSARHRRRRTLTRPQLDNADLKKGLKVFWFATGKDDGLITTTNATVDLFKKHGFDAGLSRKPPAATRGSTGATT